MKNVKSQKFLAIFIAILMLAAAFFSMINQVEAATSPTFSHVEKTNNKFNAKDVLKWSAVYGSTEKDITDPAWQVIPTEINQDMINKKEAIEILKEGQSTAHVLNASDAATLKYMISGNTKTNGGADQMFIAKSITKSLKDVQESDITLKYTIELPLYKKGSVNVASQTITYTIVNGKINESQNVDSNNKKIEEYKTNVHWADITDQYDYPFISVKATIAGTSQYKGSEYELRLAANGNWFNQWMLIRTKAPTPTPTPSAKPSTSPSTKPSTSPSASPSTSPSADPGPSDPADTEFKTTLEYKSEPAGKLIGGTYYPPYYENDDARKDVDATALIKSKTDEEIKATNGVDLTTDGKPNSEGWYYPDVNDKKVIAKDYPFDTYDNTTDNGMVKETVLLTGAEGGEDSQTPSIKWTFRRKVKEEKENPDGSITVTITYNLPVDEDSIPSDWSPVYDDDGTTIHKIQRVIKKGEDYDKDVPVKQNGTDATVVTPVKIEWEKAPVIPQAGSALAVVVAGIVIVSGIALVSYRKYRA